MSPVRRSATHLALLAFASGCSGCDEPELHPDFSARGRITYVANNSDVSPFRDDPQNTRSIEQARDAQLQVQGPVPQDAPSSPQGRSEPVRVATADPETEDLDRLQRRAQLLNAQRDALYSQDSQANPRSSLAERRQEDREWHEAWQARRDRDRQEDAMRHAREAQEANDGMRALLRTQEQIRQQR